MNDLEQVLEEDIKEYLKNMPDSYRQRFSEEDARLHIHSFLMLSYTRPILIQHTGDDVLTLTFYSFDRIGVFSFLCGILGSMDFHILEGSLYSAYLEKAWRPGLVMCVLQGRIDDEEDVDTWKWQLEQQLLYLFRNIARENYPIDDIQHEVIRHVARRLQRGNDAPAILHPIDLDIDNSHPTYTKIDVQSNDTSFFLYLFSHVLYLHGLDLTNIEIHTDGQKIHDSFYFVDKNGKKIEDPQVLLHIRLLVLITKQLSYFLTSAPDPSRTLFRLDSFIQDISKHSAEHVLETLLDNPEAGRDLSRLLGSSDFLWEEFIRVQREGILPLLTGKHKTTLRSLPLEELEEQLRMAVAKQDNLEDKKKVFNDFKNREAYLIDIDHIINEDLDFFFLSERLSQLADAILRVALDIAWEDCVQRYGKPLTISGLPARWVACGLGKLGGRALGYASDIELLFLYSDDGKTSMKDPISNREFFQHFFQQAISIISARRSGIFHVDTRLRPFNLDGPLAVHINQFVSYYGPRGEAHSVEKLALIRLRPIAGDADFGQRLIGIRDQLVYHTADNINIADIRSMRKLQLKEKLSPGKLNAKFSPGALVDLEYNVQILQIKHATKEAELCSPEIHRALHTLSNMGTIDSNEAEYIIRANQFFRNLINGLRMLRGDASDLFLPDYKSNEFAYLARRLRYNTETGGGIQQLQIDFETYTARVRTFVEKHLGDDALSGGTGTIIDLLLRQDFEENASTRRILEDGNIKNYRRALDNLKSLSDDSGHSDSFLSLIVIVWDVLRMSIDPDMALNNWERFSARISNTADYYHQLLSQPRRAEILLMVCSASSYLSDLLITHPEYLSWLSTPGVLTRQRSFATMKRGFSDLPAAVAGQGLHYARQREMLRIATRDICLNTDFVVVAEEISALAEATMVYALEQCTEEEPSFSILVFGKLGGRELNYSSDIDLLCIYDSSERTGIEEECEGQFRNFIAEIGGFHGHDRGYRIDLRLGPYGSLDKIVHSYSSCLDYYRNNASIWELQATSKLSYMAGNRGLGEAFCRNVRSIVQERLSDVSPATLVADVLERREQAVAQYSSNGIDVKNGIGGLRDVEFLVQTLELIHYPEVAAPNSLNALSLLEEGGQIDADDARSLRDGYIFLRKIEHALQIQGDRQLHVVHSSDYPILARIMREQGVEEFAEHLKAKRQEVRRIFLSYMGKYQQ